MCTRITYHGHQDMNFTARSMDWKSDLRTNLWVLPRGAARNGQCGPNSIEWTAQYGSVIAAAYDVCSTDGVNEKGLSVNLLWLTESEYPVASASTKPLLSIAAWAQYVLDQFASVQEAIDALSSEPFSLVSANVPGEERLTTLHMSLSDSSGDSAIIEYIKGQPVIHHSRDYQVMTNSPTYDEQLALNKYWESIGGTVMLPGTNRAADRFARAAFYINAVEKQDDPDLALASVLSVIRNASVPFGLSTPDAPNISSTRWRTVVDHKRQRYYFESTTTPNVFWVDLQTLDFSAETGKILKLDLGENQRNIFHGQVNASCTPSPMFTFLGCAP